MFGVRREDTEADQFLKSHLLERKWVRDDEGDGEGMEWRWTVDAPYRTRKVLFFAPVPTPLNASALYHTLLNSSSPLFTARQDAAYEGLLGGPEVDEEDEEEIKEQDEFEELFNFRYEEPGGAFVATYPREIEGSVRRKMETRKLARKARAERKAALEAERQAELRRLKNLKKQDILEKLKKIKLVAGLGGGDGDGGGKGGKGDLPTRFKYQQVKPNNYGLKVDQILQLRDKDLNQIVSLKKLAPYQPEEWVVPKWRRRQVLSAALRAQQDEDGRRKREAKGRKKGKGKDGKGKGRREPFIRLEEEEKEEVERGGEELDAGGRDEEAEEGEVKESEGSRDGGDGKGKRKRGKEGKEKKGEGEEVEADGKEEDEEGVGEGAEEGKKARKRNRRKKQQEQQQQGEGGAEKAHGQQEKNKEKQQKDKKDKKANGGQGQGTGGGAEGEDAGPKLSKAVKKNLQRKQKRHEKMLLEGKDGKQALSVSRLQSYGVIPVEKEKKGKEKGGKKGK
ncbi:unnamed protein product [Closterium sp. Yama58-4]|nr:unnamed protein product [Closterium sp. Yama58-4]